MPHDINGDAVGCEQNANLKQFAGLSWTHENRQPVVALLVKLVDVMDHGVFDLIDGVSALQGGVRDPHSATLVANATGCNHGCKAP
jgi:hypothetical protein